MTAYRPKTLLRALVGLLSLGVLLTPALLPNAGGAATQDPKNRVVSAPSVFYPVKGRTTVKDLRTSTARHAGTDILAPCNAGVYASHPGIVQVQTGGNWTNYVRVKSNNGGLLTSYAYLNKVLL